MAYLLSLTNPCDATGCGKRAVLELHNRYNASCGKFCGPHAQRRLKELQKDESDPRTFPRPLDDQGEEQS